VLVGAACVAGLAGCTSSTTSGTTTTRASTSSTTTPRTSTTASTSSTTTSSPTGLSRCPTGDFTGTVAGSSVAAGTIELTIALRSSSATSCILGGYPGLQLLAANGSALPTKVERKGTYSFTSMAPTTVTLTSGQSAEFNIGYSDVPVGNESSCPTASSMEVTPPNATDHLVVTAMLAPCGGGTVVVSPVFAPGSAG
jgi:hypothetical protein